MPSLKGLSGDAAKRLEAIASLEDLGAGFVLATHDLEIRGAGEFLGEAQSGELSEVGLSLYLEMLEHAVSAMRAGREPALERPLAASTDIELHLPALLPADYVPDVHLRLALYQRIAAADAGALQDMTAELIDRFGALPDAGAQPAAAGRAAAAGARARDCAASSSVPAAAACSSRSTIASSRRA